LFFNFSCSEDTIEPEAFGTISGEIVLEADDAPIDRVTISTSPATTSLFTDELGMFQLESVPVGSYTVTAEKEGFLARSEGVTVSANKTSNVIIKLRVDTFTNVAPMQPFNPFPENNSIDQEVDLNLTWSAFDEDGDALRFDVELFEGSQSVGTIVLSSSTDTMVEVSGLSYNTNYFWQVSASDGRSDKVFSEVWSFRTKPFPNNRFLFTREENGSYDIYSSDMEGNAIKLTSNTAVNWRPRMSPTRNQIAFLSNQGIEPQLYVMNPDGTDQRQVTTLPVAGVNNFDLDFAWSPDGTQLLYMNNNMLYRINTDGNGLQAITESPSGLTFTEVDWTASGNKILARTTGDAIYKSQIFILNIDGTYEQQIIHDEPGSLGGGMYSINGTKILYTYDVSGFESSNGRQLDARIFQIDINSGITIDLSYDKVNGTNDLDARYSPDGAKIIFTNTNNDGISPKSI